MFWKIYFCPQYILSKETFFVIFIHCVLWVMKIKMKWDIWLWKKKMFKTSLFFRFLPTVMMLVFVEEDGVSVSLVFFRSRSSWATALLPILRQTVSNAMMNIFVQRRIYSTVFENRQKSRIQYCERSELRLHDKCLILNFGIFHHFLSN